MEGPQGRYIATREGRSKKTTAKKELAMGDFQKKVPAKRPVAKSAQSHYKAG